MRSLRRLALPALVLLLALGATPAHATLLVRSDNNGLLISDKNGLNDDVEVHGDGSLSGQPAYRIRTLNVLDIFKYDRQAGCFQDSNHNETVICRRVNPFLDIRLSSGNDFLRLDSGLGGVANVTGGSGNDEIRGVFDAGSHQFFGDAGDDLLIGANPGVGSNIGSDKLFGGAGNDELDGQGGDDTLEGGSGNDLLKGGSGTDVLRGGTGGDTIISKELGVNPSEADAVDCGSGFDTVEADLKDNIQADCNEVDRSPVGETPNVDILGKTLRVSRSGKVRVGMRCPRGVKRLGCKGRLQLRIDRRASSSSSRKVRYKIKAGKRKTVTLRLTPSDVRSLRSRQRRGRKTRGILASVEKGRKGRKTTIRNPRLKFADA
jgi:hypothetical protein